MNSEGSFLDSKTIVAIVLVAVIWIGWQAHLTKKYGKPTAAVSAVENPVQNVDETKPAAAASTEITEKSTSLAPETKTTTVTNSKTETFLEYTDEVWSFKVSSKGMGLKDVKLNKFKDTKGETIVLANTNAPYAFQTELLGAEESLYFDLKKEGNTFSGTAVFGGLTIVKTMEVDSQKYALKTRIDVSGFERGIRGVTTWLKDKVTAPESTSWLMPMMEGHSLYVDHNTTYAREHLTHDASGKIGETYTNVSIASLGSLYFTTAVFDKSEIHPQVEAQYLSEGENKFVVGQINYLFNAGVNETTVNYMAFAGPKELGLLKSIDPKFEQIIDFWVLGSIAKPMLKLMKWFNSVTGNWGVAIILLTLVVRMLVLPLYMSSYKSMKAMQKIQPQMKALREKYAKDPQQMNTEVMRLFKENKVNPLGGCFPMLLQLPIFMALYRVFSQSIELYQAPFILWIKDLSIKDPYFVLPVLMGISMFIQQKITPTTTTDPAQQKVLLFMPVFFSFLMLTLPSGLTLYIFVSTLFGIIQQFIFMREKSTAKA